MDRHPRSAVLDRPRPWSLRLLVLAPLLLAACLPAPLGAVETGPVASGPVGVVQAVHEAGPGAATPGDRTAERSVEPAPDREPLASSTEPTPGDQPAPAKPAASTVDPVAPIHSPAEAPCDPSGANLPPMGPEVRRTFREPLAPAPLWSPPGPKRVGLQAGHWLVEQSPGELSRLQAGTSGGGKQEWEVNLDIAQRAKLLLEAAGVEVDLLPATVPMRYRAHAFVSIHADGDAAGQLSGFKVARPGFSSIPAEDDHLVAALNGAYAVATGLPRDDEHISLRMRYYYAFNSRRYCHAVAPGVPQAIVETGFLTSAADRGLLLGNPDAAARGIAGGVLAFLSTVPGG
jgi:N-acetylmuramoyl-L-alanine amidase